MENELRFCVGFYCVFRSTQPTVVIESFYRTHIILFLILIHDIYVIRVVRDSNNKIRFLGINLTISQLVLYN